MSPARPPLRFCFAVEGGSRLGMGHLMRCAALVRSAQQRGHRTSAFVRADPAAMQTWTRACPATTTLDDDTRRSPSFADLLFIDRRGDKTDWLDIARAARVPAIVLDDRQHADRADLTICPALHESPCDEPPVLAGPGWSILAPEHRVASAVGRRFRLLVTLGGADPHRVAPRIAPTLMKVLVEVGPAHGIESFDLVLGPAFPDPERAVAERLAREGWTVHRALGVREMARLMEESVLSLCGFGTSLSELAAHRTPFLTITHHLSDRGPASRLEALGIGRLLGNASDLDLDRSEAIFREALEDEAWRRESALRAFEAIAGGDGTRRVLDVAEQLATGGSAKPRV